MVRKYFIDGGGNKGQSAKYARDLFPGYTIHSFECYPNFGKFYENLPVIFHPEAIWIYDGEHDFYCGDSEGSTVLKGKLTGHIDYSDSKKIPCLDFSKWLKDNFTENDEIILKLNIEGAEIEVLKKLIKDGTIKLIDKLFVNFHSKKIQTLVLKEERKLIQKLVDLGLEPHSWVVPRGMNYYLTD